MPSVYCMERDLLHVQSDVCPPLTDFFSSFSFFLLFWQWTAQDPSAFPICDSISADWLMQHCDKHVAMPFQLGLAQTVPAARISASVRERSVSSHVTSSARGR
jgi:hypothetical protein